MIKDNPHSLSGLPPSQSQLQANPLRPKRIFRYFSPARSNLFNEQRLWFSNSADFNDVFETCPRYDKLIEDMSEELTRRSFAFTDPATSGDFYQFKKLSRQNRLEFNTAYHQEFAEAFQNKISRYFGIVCFSENFNSLLMWGHYTDCHRGFVVEFVPEHSIFAPSHFAKVIYGTDRPQLTQDTDSQMLLRKSSEWEYEAEYRIIKKKTDLTSGTYDRFGKQVEGHFVPLPMDAIKAVYFGLRISKEHRQALLEPLKHYPAVSKFFMRRNTLAYKLDPVPRDDWKPPLGVGELILKRPWIT